MVNDSFTLRLTSRPTADVTIGVASSDLTEGIVSASQIVFTPQNWYLPQTVVVSGVDDGEVDGVALYNILLGGVSSADSHYAGMSIASLQASNADNDIPGSAFQIAVSNTFITSAIRNDSLGNTYITGYFWGTVDFDPGVGITQLTSPARFSLGFIVKYSSAHELIWARQFGGSDGTTYSSGLDVDSNGNAFVTGNTSSTSAVFGSSTLPGDSTNDAFLARLDSDGNFEWVRRWGGTSFVYGESVQVGAGGIIHVGGSLYGTADLDPSANTFSRTSAGGSDGYISRFTSNGAFISAVSIGGTLNDSILRTVVDAAGNTYATGSFNGTAQFGSHVLNSAGGGDYFLLKMNAGGSIEWVRQVAGAANGGAGSRLSLDSAGSVILAGYFTESINFGPGTPTLVSGGNEDSFITKWDATGTLLQVGQLSGLERVRVTGLTVGKDDVMTIVGWFAGTADLDPGSNELLVTTLDAQNGFILRMHSGGNVMTVLQTSGGGVIRDVTQDAKGNISAFGTFSSTVSLPTGQVFVNADASSDLYVLKLNIAAGATVSPSVGLVTSEDGTSTSFNVVLDIRPTADVTIPVSSSDSNEGVVSTSSLTFTPANWNVPQTVIVTGVDDTAIDGDKSYSIVLGPATSADPAYEGFNANDLRVTNTDNDAPLVLFTDSFEVGEWNGLWVEDSQNDWFRSSQRATNGSWAAEVDGSANNATLTIGSAIDLSGMQTATLTFDWLIESGFDAGEYLSLDVSTNGGSTWIQDVRRLNGNVDTENVWHNETVDLTAYSSSNLKIRFRSKVSASDEDANVDNVRITAIPAGPNTLPVAVAGGPYAMNEGGSVTLSASGSSDIDGTITSYAWDFDGDGQYDDASGASVNFATTQSGSPVIGLRVTDNRGATATTTTTVAVNNVAPTASAGVDQSASKGTVVSLSAASSSDPGNDIVSYAWDLNGNGQYTDASGVNATFSSAVAGVFTVSVKVTDADGAVSFDSATITVSDASTKFYVVNDATTDATYEYAADGTWIENYTINSGNSSPRGAASTAAGTTVWVADKNRKVYVYDTAGGLQGSWTAGTLSSRAQVEGLATNGTDVWIVDNRSDSVYRYTNAAGRLSGSQTAASSFSLNTSNTNPKGIVTDGTYLWVVNDSSSDRVFKYTLSGSLVGSWTIDSGNQTPTGLTIDPSNGSQSIWIVDSGTDRVYEYVGARSRVSGSQAAGITFALAAGNSNPQGIADPPPVADLEATPQRPTGTMFSKMAMVASRPATTVMTKRERHCEFQEFTLSTERDRPSDLVSLPNSVVRRNTRSRLEMPTVRLQNPTVDEVGDLSLLDGVFETIDDDLFAILDASR